MSDYTIEIRNYNLSLKTATSEIRLLKDINAKIISGSVTAITGPSGAGKSLLASAIMQLIDWDKGFKQSGDILLCNQPVTGSEAPAPEQWRGRRISMIFQNPASAFNPVIRCTEQILEACKIVHQHNQSEGLEKLNYWLKKIGLDDVPHIYDAYPHQLSGGQLQRLMFIMAMINQPDCIIADEPTTALDIWHTAEQLKLWKAFCREHQTTLILVTHDLNLVRYLADHVIFLKNGELAYQAEKEVFFNHCISHEVSRFTEDYFYFENNPRLPAFKKMPPEILLKADQIYKRFPDSTSWLKTGFTDVLSAISFTLNKGAILGITGASGSGKTTLLLCLLKLIAAYRGKLFWKNTDVTCIPERDLRPKRKDFQIVFQDAYKSLPHFMTVRQIIAEACRAADMPVFEETILKVLQDVQLRSNTLHQLAGSLSGGELQRLSLARAIVMSPDLIILDEPFSAMDPTLQRQMVELILKYRTEQNGGIILVSHDLPLIQYLADDLLVLESGKIADLGPVDHVLSNPSASFKKLLHTFNS